MIQSLLTETMEKLGTELQWGWDERWNTALMVVQGDAADEFVTKLESVFAHGFGADSIESADEGVQALAQNMGGLRAGQRLFAQVVSDGVWLYAACWPWVGNSHLSVRVGIYGANHDLDIRTTFAPDSLKPKS